jgi:hypothetical protein
MFHLWRIYLLMHTHKEKIGNKDKMVLSFLIVSEVFEVLLCNIAD